VSRDDTNFFISKSKVSIFYGKLLKRSFCWKYWVKSEINQKLLVWISISILQHFQEESMCIKIYRKKGLLSFENKNLIPGIPYYYIWHNNTTIYYFSQRALTRPVYHGRNNISRPDYPRSFLLLQFLQLRCT